MARRLPPLNPMRSFEAVARHGRIAKAAEELNVTPSAITHQVRVLESYLGVKLFQRDKRRLRLTDAGRHLLPNLGRAFDLMAESAAELLHPTLRGTLRVHAPATFTSRWLLPCLHEFSSAYPQVQLSLHSLAPMSKQLPKDFDVAIEYGLGRWERRWVRRLTLVEMFPLCSPILLNNSSFPMRTPSDLRHFSLIHDDDGWAWSQWLSAAGVSGIDTGPGLGVSSANHALEAAILGLGVALGDQLIVSRDLEEGKLLRPFALTYPSAAQYYVVCEPDRLHVPILRAFLQWLFGRVGERFEG
jgi:LysR family transcriptional regulator, glycine cleavage system transcriptional activator